MELVCNKCGFRRNIGTVVHTKEVFVCTECTSTDVKLVDAGGVVIKVDGVNQDTIINVVKELASNISIYDIFNFLAKQGKVKEKDDDQENK